MEEKSFDTSFLGQTYTVHYIKNRSDAAKAISFLMKKDCLFAVDTETAALEDCKVYDKAGLSPHLSEVRLLQVFDGENVVVFDLKWFLKSDLQLFSPFLNLKRFVAHNATFELMQFQKWGIENVNCHCTFLMARLIQQAIYPEDNHPASLKALAESLLNVDVFKHAQASDWSVPDLTFEQIEYAALDTVICYHLANKLIKGLEKLNLWGIYKIVREAQAPIAAMQLNGLKLDIPRHRELIPKWINELVDAKLEVEKLTGITSLTAPKISTWLETNLDASTLAIWPRTERGKLSTSADTFADFSYHEIVKPFSIYQKKAVLASTFGDKLINQVNPKTGRLHASYKLLGARTGRLSCGEPNLQNLPRDFEVRNNFIPSEGTVFLCADYSQIELRLAAEVSRDREMLNAYREGIDLHILTASRVLNKGITLISKKERQIGKALGLGLLYGLGPKKFSHYVKKGYSKDGLTVTEAEATRYIEKYRETYKGLRKWQISQAENCRVSKIAKTVSGKIRKLTEETYYGGGLNVPIQGAAAEIMMIALSDLYECFKPFGKLVNCVHDEVIIELDSEYSPIGKSGKELKRVESHMEELKSLMETCMIEAYTAVFPDGVTRDLVDASYGLTWAACKEAPKETKKVA